MADKSQEVRNILDGVFADYNFGDGIVVQGSDTWQTDEAPNYTKVVYVEYAGDEMDTSDKLSFHVDLNEDLTVGGAVAYFVSSGGETGFLPPKSSKSALKV